MPFQVFVCDKIYFRYVKYVNSQKIVKNSEKSPHCIADFECIMPLDNNECVQFNFDDKWLHIKNYSKKIQAVRLYLYGLWLMGDNNGRNRISRKMLYHYIWYSLLL